MKQRYLKPWRKKYLVFGEPNFGGEEIESVIDCIRSNWVGTGPRVNEFEDEFASYIGSPSAVAVNSCTAALYLCLRQYDFPYGSEVIVPSMTFCATANAVVNAGYKPIFVDCDPRSFVIDPADVEKKITNNTKLIIVVHFAGYPCPMDKIGALANQYGLRIMEDCAHAIESTVEGRHCGTFSDFGCFSFYVTKNITTVEGGMIVAADAKHKRYLQQQALHGLNNDAWKRFSDDGFKHYEVVSPGLKCNMTDLAASLGLAQLKKISVFRMQRKWLWDYYSKNLKGLPLILPILPPENCEHGLHLYTCLIDHSKTAITRDSVLDSLHRLKIGAGVHYTALHLHKYYSEKYGYRKGDLPISESIGKRIFSIPFSSKVTKNDAADVVKALSIIFQQ